MSARAAVAVLSLLGALFALLAGFSLEWRMQGDTPLYVYIGWLIDRWQLLPYRDIYDVNLPGVFLAYVGLGRLFGQGDLGCRVADLGCLAVLLALTAAWLRSFGWKPALGGALGFGVWYLGCGPEISLQRDFLALIPIAAAGAITSTSLDARARAAIAGLLFGVASTIKPAAGLGLPWLVIWHWLEPGPGGSARVRRGAGLACAAGLGLAVPLAATAVSLWATGTWPYLRAIALDYWPLYAEITGRFEVLPAEARALHLLERFLVVEVAGHAVRILPAVFGAVWAWRNPNLTATTRRQVLLLSGLAASYSVYPVLGGKFWTYHLILYLYFLIALAALCLVDSPRPARALRGWLGLLFFSAAIFTAVRPSHVVFDQLRGQDSPPPLQSRVDAIARYLLARKRPGDAAQALDWTGGAIHAMLLARLPSATPYLYDVQFYHGVSTPYVRALRREFVEQLRSAAPRFVIQIQNHKPWVRGVGTTRRFRELESLLAERYRVALAGDGYAVHERDATVGPDG